MQQRTVRIVVQLLSLLVALGLGFVWGRWTAPGPSGSAADPAALGDGADAEVVDDFLALLADDRTAVFQGLTNIAERWHPGYRAMLLETLSFVRNPIAGDGILELLAQQTGQNYGGDLDAWYRWIWQEPYQPHPDYALFKARLYQQIDGRFGDYFVTGASRDSRAAEIRLDEIRWGGVRRDGIPPLKDPATLAADEATYLADSDVVFGVHILGEARAYPKRILAWHEMVKDQLGGESINGVYCTLCGSMIVYRTTDDAGQHYELGTSGFLYRSNKLMYDHDTASLWSTIEGTPVVGPLVGKGIKLEPLPVVTTTWGKWKSMHTDTRVLSLETGFDRDYGEGVAYRDYFATDQLMFAVPSTDKRLKNKDSVFIVRVAASQPLAISLAYLRENPVYHDSVGDVSIVVLTDETGANRAYDAGDHRYVELSDNRQVRDEDDVLWHVSEDALISNDGALRRPRLPAHQAFWFGWYSAHPETRLVP